MEAVQTRSRATEERILTAAGRLLEQVPFESLSMVMIAQAAGVSVGGVYGRFGSKEALLQSLFRRYEDERTADLLEAFDKSRWAGAGLQARAGGVCAAIVSVMRRRRGLLRAFLLHHWSQPATRDSSFDGRLRTAYDAAATLIAEAPDAQLGDSEIRMAMAIVAGACRDIIVMKPPGAPGAVSPADGELIEGLTRAMLGIIGAKGEAR